MNCALKKVIVLLSLLALAPTVWALNVESMHQELDQLLNSSERIFNYAGKTLVATASDTAFKDYFLAATSEERARIKHKIDFLSLRYQNLHSIDEMCLIDKSGKEISRIVFREIAPDKDLSNEESSAPFFKPSFATEANEYYVSEPYVSADSLRWVVCFATPIVLDDGSTVAIYHFEMSYYIFQGMFNAKYPQDVDSYFLLVDKEGYVRNDSRTKFKLELNPQDTELKLPLSDYFPRFKDQAIAVTGNKISSGGKGAGTFVDGDKTYSYAYRPFDLYDWTMVLVKSD